MVGAVAVRGRGSYGRRFGVLFVLGLVGIVALVPSLASSLEELAEGGGLPPLPVLVMLSLVQPALLLAAAVAAGTALAPRLGLRSHLAGWVAGERVDGAYAQRDLAVALLTGLATALALLLLDGWTRRWLGAAADELSLTGGRTAWLTLAGLLYGGVTEELMLRWGLLSALAFAGWKLFARGRETPGAGVMWGAIILAALAFGAAHLPAVSMAVTLTGPVVLRTIALNAIGGIAFGWLFWRRSLEAAMIAHAALHVVFTAAAIAGI